MPGTRVHLRTLGCRLNEAELETWTRDFRARGWEPVPEPDHADLVVVNTCAVTEAAARKSRQLVRRSQRANPRAKLVVSGCYATLDGARTQADLGVDVLVPNSDKNRLVEITLAALGQPEMPVAAIEPDIQPLLRVGRQRAFVKVQDGCRYRCSYCVVTLARGEERSRPVTEVVTEINALHANGVQEAVLTGVHLGGYGVDRGTDLGKLIDAVLSETDIPRIRLGSLEPWDLPRRFWHRFENPRLMPHLHLPVQSGSDSVLRRMSRRCRADEFKKLVTDARASVPDINITTDIIVGFPGESQAEWQETLALVEAIRFGHIHIFAYSPRTGTKAATLPDQVTRAEKRRRSAQLHELVERNTYEYLSRYIGRSFPVLVESANDNEQPGRTWSGYTPNYIRVQFRPSDDRDLENQLVQVKVIGVRTSGDGLLAEVVPHN